MAASQAANVVERTVGHGDNATVTTDVSNYAKDEYGEETGAKIKATTWQGKNSVKLGVYPKRYFVLADTPSRDAQAESHRRRGCHSQGNRQYNLRE